MEQAFENKFLVEGFDARLAQMEKAIAKLNEGCKTVARRNVVLLKALEESVKLQSHYAKLLNQYDGGERMTFESAQAWIDRLAHLATHHSPLETGAKRL